MILVSHSGTSPNLIYLLYQNTTSSYRKWLAVNTTAFWCMGWKLPLTAGLTVGVIIFICTYLLFKTNTERETEQVTALRVALRYATFYGLWLFTLCSWIVGLVIALYRDKIRLFFFSCSQSGMLPWFKFPTTTACSHQVWKSGSTPAMQQQLPQHFAHLRQWMGQEQAEIK